jgi:HD-like signal output (HDOD) protein
MDTNVSDDAALVDSILDQTLKDIGIPSRPKILDRVAAEMSKDEPNFRNLGQLVNADVGLAASFIKTANSPFLGFKSKARSASDALMMLGLDAANRVIAGINVRKAFASDIRLEKFWQESAQIAALSGLLAQMMSRRLLATGDAHTFGLFRDCGIPVMLTRFRDYEEIFSHVNDDTEHPFTEVERKGLTEFPTDHAIIGYLLAQNWLLPEEIALAIRHHHEPSILDTTNVDLPTTSRKLIAVGRTAEHILNEVKGAVGTNEWRKSGVSCLRALDLTESEIVDMYQTAGILIDTVD